jgi:hypothetical protein
MLKRRSYKNKRVTFRSKTRRSNTRRSNTRRSNTRRSNTRRSNTRRSNTRRSKTRRSKKQKGGGLEPFKESDFGTYEYDEYYEVEPEQGNIEDEGFEPDELGPTLEYNNVFYPIYTDIDESDEYIMLNDDEGNAVMVKTSAIRKTHNLYQ